VLHRITKALAEVGLDIRHARVQTLGNEVVDTFYVRTLAGAKVTDADYQREVNACGPVRTGVIITAH